MTHTDISPEPTTPFAHAYCGQGGEKFLATTAHPATEDAINNYPYRELAEIIHENRFCENMPEVVVLGCGAGRTEAKIIGATLALANQQGQSGTSVAVTAVDINQSYFDLAEKTIEQGFEGLATMNFNPMIGDFTSPACWGNIREACANPPLILICGSTVGNLHNSGAEFINCVSASPAGTLLVVDFQLAYTSSDRIEEITELDPAVKNLKNLEEYQHWFRWMLTSRGMDTDIDLEIRVVPISASNNQTCFPGGYRLEITTADLRVIFSFQRFDLCALRACFENNGWTAVGNKVFNRERSAALVFKKC